MPVLTGLGATLQGVFKSGIIVGDALTLNAASGGDIAIKATGGGTVALSNPLVSIGDTTGAIARIVGYLEMRISGPLIKTGTAVPVSADPDGSIYLRSGAPNGTVYVRQAGAWVLK